MTEEKLNDLIETKKEIKRLEEILYTISKTWKIGRIKSKKKIKNKWKFVSSYGAISGEIELLKDEVEALENYLIHKLNVRKAIIEQS